MLLFKKTASEKALLKVAKNKFNSEKRKIYPNFKKKGFKIGVSTKKIWELGALLAAAEKVEVMALDQLAEQAAA